MREGSRIKVRISASCSIFTYTQDGAMGIKVQKGWQNIDSIEMCLPITGAQIPCGRYISVFNIVCSRLVVDERRLMPLTERE